MKITARGHGLADLSIVDAHIQVLSVQLRSTDGSYLTFLEEPFEISLLDLTSGIDPILGRARIPDGSYDLVRLVTADEGMIELSDGRKLSLWVPSGTQTGIKVFMDPPLQVSRGTIARVALVFDVSKSFVAGNEEFLFKPVIRPDITATEDTNPDDGTDTDPPGDGTGDGTGGDGSGDGTVGGGDDGNGGPIDFPVIGA